MSVRVKRWCGAGLRRTLAVFGAVAALCSPLAAQMPAVRLFPAGIADPDDRIILQAARALHEADALLDLDRVREQSQRTACELILPAARCEPLAGRQIWQIAQQSYLRIGWYYMCTKCDRWHLRLAGGYVITADGAVVTCAHALSDVPENMRVGFLLAADDQGQVFPIDEILAVDPAADVAILRVQASGLVPLPLNTDVAPGDRVWCYSEPLRRRGYFSQGIINRFVVKGRGDPADLPVALNVSADWAPGSSGAALLDDFGNAIGHVARIEFLSDRRADSETSGRIALVIHEAASARDVLRLISPAVPPPALSD